MSELIGFSGNMASILWKFLPWNLKASWKMTLSSIDHSSASVKNIMFGRGTRCGRVIDKTCENEKEQFDPEDDTGFFIDDLNRN